MATFKNCRFLPRIFSAVLSSVKRSHDQVVNYNFSSFTNQASGVAIKSFANGTHTRFLSINAADTSEENKDEEEKEETSETLETARPVVDVATSIDYLKSEAYKKTYRGSLVWQPYRRNHKGHLPPKKIRRSCYSRAGKAYTGNPCPICRDDHLVLHPDNTKLLEQFVSFYTGEILSNHTTNLCQLQQTKLRVAIEQAWDKGYLEKVMPFREYNYEEYYGEKMKKEEEEK